MTKKMKKFVKSPSAILIPITGALMLLLSGIVLLILLNNAGYTDDGVSTQSSVESVIGFAILGTSFVGSVMMVIGTFVVWPMVIWARKVGAMEWVMYGIVIASIVGYFVVKYRILGTLTTEDIVADREYVSMLRSTHRAFLISYALSAIGFTSYLLIRKTK